MQDLVGVAGPLVQGDLVEAKELDLTVLSVYPPVQWGYWMQGHPYEVLKTVLGT